MHESTDWDRCCPGREQDWQMEGGCMLTNSEWLGINELSLLIHGTDAVQDMKRYFLEALRNIVPFERAAFFSFMKTRRGSLSCNRRSLSTWIRRLSKPMAG